MRTVDTLMSRLKHEGLTVFVDRNGIRPGDQWPFEIASAIKTCKAFVCVLTKRYIRSIYCNGELYEAEALGKPLFPVVCEKGWEDVPGGAPVTEVVQEVQLVSLVAEDSENQLTRLVQSIKGQSVHCNHSHDSVTTSPILKCCQNSWYIIHDRINLFCRSCGTFITIITRSHSSRFT